MTPIAHNHRILVIDDNPSIHEDYKKILIGVEDEGLDASRADLFGDAAGSALSAHRFLIESAFQGQEGLQCVEAACRAGKPFAMAFVDMRMPPGWDGVETIHRIWEVYPELQVVIATAYADYTLEEMIARLGRTDRFVILKKPFDSVEVLQLANALTEKWRLAHELHEHLTNLEGQVAERTRDLSRMNAALRQEMAEREQAQQQLMLRDTALEAAANAITIADREGKIIWINPAFTKLTGYSAEEAIGQYHRDLKSGTHPREFYETMWKTLLAGEIWRGELIGRRKDGSRYPEEVTITPMRGAMGEVTHIIAIIQDITERKRVEAELAAARDTALAAVRSKSLFLANMSHEIRTPMNGVIGMAGLLLETTLDREQRDYVEAIHHSGDLLMTIINDILDFSKIDAGKLAFETLDFDVREVVESTLELLAEQTQAKGLELIGQVDPEVFTHLCGDPGRLGQVLTNLLNNAIKFTDRGEVVVRVSRESSMGAEDKLRFEIRDTGIGISAETQQRLFQPFHQADNSTTRKYGGTGLGLAISRQLVAMMHGEIGALSELGKGSTFWFTACFPRQTTVPPRREPAGFEGLRTLIVDDNATNRKDLTEQLTSLQMRCTSATGGCQALEILRRENAGPDPFVLAILDMQMPEMDGVTLAEAIKADPTLAPTRLIMLSSLGHNFSAERIQAAGIEEYLVKPAKHSRLHDCLAAVVGRREQRVVPIAAAPPLPVTEAPRHTASILLAEDNRINQKVALQQLKKLGYHADVAANGDEVLAALARIPYDLILMDGQMPELDGYEATMRIRREQTRPIHIIAMTAHAMEGDREKCLAAGMDDYLTKPVRTADLEAALARWESSKGELR